MEKNYIPKKTHVHKPIEKNSNNFQSNFSPRMRSDKIPIKARLIEKSIKKIPTHEYHSLKIFEFVKRK